MVHRLSLLLTTIYYLGLSKFDDTKLELPTDEEDLEIRILLILSPQHSDIWIHSDEQGVNSEVVLARPNFPLTWALAPK